MQRQLHLQSFMITIKPEVVYFATTDVVHLRSRRRALVHNHFRRRLAANQAFSELSKFGPNSEMFRREKPITLKGSVSALCNNLSVQVNTTKKQIQYAVAHKSVVNLVNAAADGSNVTHRQVVCKEPSGGPAMIIQVG